MVDNELKYLQEKIEAIKDRNTGEPEADSNGHFGLDIGSSHIITARNGNNRVTYDKQLNAFFTIPDSRFARNILNKNDVFYFEQNRQFYIVGYAAEEFANMFNTSTRRTIKKGLVNADEDVSLDVMRSILTSLIKKTGQRGKTVCYVVPGEPLEKNGSVIYHAAVIKNILTEMGYKPVTVDEGMAVVLSEMASDDYTGIGINMGGGMCNVCLSYMSHPVLKFSIQKAGDYIDTSAGISVGEPATKIKQIKENELSLLVQPKDRITSALHIFYEETFCHLTNTMRHVLLSAEAMPHIVKPIPIVLGGGTVMPEGCLEWFENALKKIPLPIEISSVRVAADPLGTASRGALIMAKTESG